MRSSMNLCLGLWNDSSPSSEYREKKKKNIYGERKKRILLQNIVEKTIDISIKNTCLYTRNISVYILWLYIGTYMCIGLCAYIHMYTSKFSAFSFVSSIYFFHHELDPEREKKNEIKK